MSEPGYFIDTNVIIDFLKKRETSAVQQLTELLEEDTALYINRIVLLETLRTMPSQQNEQEYKNAKKIIFNAFQLLDVDHEIVMRSIELNRHGRSQGVSMKKEEECGWLDYVHFATAEKSQITIISNDKDFKKIEEIAAERGRLA